jgi:hypothetical protein
VEAFKSRGNFGTSPTPVQLEDKGFLELGVLLIGPPYGGSPIRDYHQTLELGVME